MRNRCDKSPGALAHMQRVDAPGNLSHRVLCAVLAAMLFVGMASPLRALAYVPADGRAGLAVQDDGSGEEGEAGGGDVGGEGEGGQTGEGGGENGQGGEGGESGGGQTGGESGGGESGGGESGGEGGGTGGGDQPAAPTLAGLYLFYENYADPNRPIAYNPTKTPLISDPQGTMRLYAQSEFTNGTIDWVTNSGVGVVWTIEEQLDEDGAPAAIDIATVERNDGVVHATGQGNGTVRVRCLAQNYDVHADLWVTVKGNSGVPYIVDLQVCDENGTPYPNDAEIRVESADFGLAKKFTAKATYHDPVTGEDEVRSTATDAGAVPGLVWTVSGDSKVAYVNDETGVFIAQSTGSVRLTCQVPHAGLLGDTVDDYVIVLCGGDTLDPDRVYSPADELKVVVKYATEDKQGIGGVDDYELARTWYYSPSELESLGVTENLYTLVKGDGNWGTMKARGVYLQALVEDVINSDTFTLDDVKGFYFAATDSYNPGFVGEGWLFETQRYYFPNMTIGSGYLGAVGVAPMIATYTVQQDLVDEPTSDLSEQTRFRLCLGAESTTVNNAQQSIYNIYQITVILNGAPPVDWDEPGTGQGTSHAHGAGGSDSSTGGTIGEGGGQEDEPGMGDHPGGTVDDPSGGGGTATPEGPGPEENPDEIKSDSGDPANHAGERPVPSDDEPAQQQADDPNPQTQQSSRVQDAADNVSQATFEEEIRSMVTAGREAAEGTADEPTSGNAEDALGNKERHWQVYEMMSRSQAEIEALALDNPLSPFLGPLALLIAAMGGASMYANYRRQLNPLAEVDGKVAA